MRAIRLILSSPAFTNGTDRAFFYSLCVISFLIPFSFKITNSVIIVAFILWLFAIKKNLKHGLIPLRYLALFTSIYFIIILGLIHSDNMDSGLGRLESRLAYVAFPVMIFISSLTIGQIRIIIYCFCAGVMGATLYCLSISLFAFLRLPQADQYYYLLTYTYLLSPLQLHPTYVGTFISFCIIFLYTESSITTKRITKGLLFASITYLLIINVHTLSRGPLLAFFILIVVYIVWTTFRRKKSKVWGLLMLGAIIGLSSYLLSHNNEVRQRFLFSIDDITSRITTPDETALPQSASSTIFHLRSWYCASKLLSDYHFFTGYGAGDEKDVLVECYTQHGWQVMIQERHNAHNEYLSSLLRTGVLELLLLVSCLLVPLILCFKYKNYLYASFLALWILVLMTTTLNLQSGIFFYAMFNALLFRSMTLHTIQMNSTNIAVTPVPSAKI